MAERRSKSNKKFMVLSALCIFMVVDHHTFTAFNLFGDFIPYNSFFMPLFVFILYSALDVFSLDIKVDIGSEDNPALSACFSGFALAFLGSVYGYFKTKNPKAGFKKQVVFLPQENACKIYVLSFIGVSIFNVVRSLILARIERAKSVQTK